MVRALFIVAFVLFIIALACTLMPAPALVLGAGYATWLIAGLLAATLAAIAWAWGAPK